jgi:hypothetical protein
METIRNRGELRRAQPVGARARHLATDATHLLAIGAWNLVWCLRSSLNKSPLAPLCQRGVKDFFGRTSPFEKGGSRGIYVELHTQLLFEFFK